MIKVCIIENNIKQMTKMRKYILNTIKDKNLDMELEHTTTDVKEFMFNIEWDEGERIYFIDVDLGGYINGIDLAVFIRKYDKYGQIVFINSFGDFSELMLEYKFKVAAIIGKKDDCKLESGVRNCLIKINKNRLILEREKEKKLILSYGSRELELIKDEIMFFEVIDSQGKIIVHCDNRQVEFKGDLPYIQERCGENFKLMSESVLVNLTNIKEIKNKRTLLIMLNGQEINVEGEKVGILDRIKKILSINGRLILNK